jgi:hypothetical protein
MQPAMKVVDSIQREAHSHEVFYQYIGIYTRNMNYILRAVWTGLCPWGLDIAILLSILVWGYGSRLCGGAEKRNLFKPPSPSISKKNRRYSGYRMLLFLAILATVALNLSLAGSGAESHAHST